MSTKPRAKASSGASKPKASRKVGGARKPAPRKRIALDEEEQRYLDQAGNGGSDLTGDDLATAEADAQLLQQANGKPIVNLKFNQFSLKRCYIDDNGEWMHPLGLYYGPRRTGKSTKLISSLWPVRDQFTFSVLFSPTADGSEVFGTMFNRLFTFNNPDQINDRTILKVQKLMHFFTVKFKQGIGGRKITCLMLFDDCGDLDMMRGKVLKNLASTARNDRITVFVAIQNFHQIPPTVRENCDFFMSNFTPKTTVRRIVWKDYWSELGTYDQFLAVFLAATAKFGSLVYTNRATEDMNDRYFTYEAVHRKPDYELICPFPKLLERLFAKSSEVMLQEIEEDLDRELDSDCERGGDSEGEDMEDLECDDAPPKRGPPKKRGAPAAKRKRSDDSDDDGGEPADSTQEPDDGDSDDAAPPKKKSRTQKQQPAKSRTKASKAKPKAASKQPAAKRKRASSSTTVEDDEAAAAAAVIAAQKRARTTVHMSKAGGLIFERGVAEDEDI
jgi:hypothetical protein